MSLLAEGYYSKCKDKQILNVRFSIQIKIIINHMTKRKENVPYNLVTGLLTYIDKPVLVYHHIKE